MTDKDLEKQLRGLKTIRPRKDWVVLTKSRILAEESFEAEKSFTSVLSAFRYKLALVPVLGIMLLVGLFGFAQNTIPGDFFFSLKKITELAQVSVTSPIERPKVQLQLANQRLADLSSIAENNQVNNLAPAIQQFQDSVTEAANNLKQLDNNVTSSDSTVVQQILEENNKLNQNKQKVEAVLGAKIGDTSQLESQVTALEQRTAEYLIKDLETRTLSAQNQSALEVAQQDYEAGNYQSALYKLWRISNN